MNQFLTVETTYAVLACLTYLLVALFVVFFGLSRFSNRLRRAWSGFRVGIAPYALPFGWLASAVAMSGSLYLSEIAGLPPCRLCWYQRIAMYPLVLLLGIATFRHGLTTAKRYFLPLAAIGGVISAYHYQLERFPDQVALACTVDLPCSVPVVNLWGFASVPFMALAAFAIIITLLWVAQD